MLQTISLQQHRPEKGRRHLFKTKCHLQLSSGANEVFLKDSCKTRNHRNNSKCPLISIKCQMYVSNGCFYAEGLSIASFVFLPDVRVRENRFSKCVNYT